MVLTQSPRREQSYSVTSFGFCPYMELPHDFFQTCQSLGREGRGDSQNVLVSLKPDVPKQQFIQYLISHSVIGYTAGDKFLQSSASQEFNSFLHLGWGKKGISREYKNTASISHVLHSVNVCLLHDANTILLPKSQGQSSFVVYHTKNKLKNQGH